MSLTKEARNDLNACIVPHEGQAGAVETPTGMLKTAKGLIIKPSTLRENGVDNFAEFTEDERRNYHLDVPKPSPKPKRTKKKAEPTQARRQLEPLTLITAAGEVPSSQYEFVCRDTSGVIVLGLKPDSFRPAQAYKLAGELHGEIGLREYNEKYLYLGQSFTDVYGVRNMILIKLPEEYKNEQTEQ